MQIVNYSAFKIQAQSLLNWLLPRLCVSCGLASDNASMDLCTYCHAILPWLEIRCYQCAALLTNANESIRCEKCQTSPPPFNRVCALFEYKPPIIKLINSLKFGQQLYPASLFGTLMAEAIQKKWYLNTPLPQLIIPVPLHIDRQRKRGYNQAAEVGNEIAKRLNIPMNINICVRSKKTFAQAKLNRERRKRNLASAFVVTNSCKYNHVALVDDVVTTGSTIRAICSVLLAAGIECIDVWSVCRA